MPDRDRLQLSLSPAAKLGALLAGLVLVGMLGVLIAVLTSIEATRSEIRTTRMGVVDADARFERVTRRLDPLLQTADGLGAPASRRLLRRAGNDLGELPDLAERARTGVDAAVFLAQDIRDSDLGGTLRAVRALAGAGLAGDRLARALDTGQAALAGVDGAALGRAVARTDRALGDLEVSRRWSTRTCDLRLRREPPAAGGQIACLLRAVPDLRRTLRAQLRANRRSVGTQQSQLSVNRRTLDLLAQSLTIQRDILERTRSIDRKTGPSPPATTALP